MNSFKQRIVDSIWKKKYKKIYPQNKLFINNKSHFNKQLKHNIFYGENRLINKSTAPITTTINNNINKGCDDYGFYLPQK